MRECLLVPDWVGGVLVLLVLLLLIGTVVNLALLLHCMLTNAIGLLYFRACSTRYLTTRGGGFGSVFGKLVDRTSG